ncbi:dehydrase and lipid transport-domain-containing protein [Polychytrium aggregatum]|uniref:dehydrase and lipid transport-domain-containing protein n=1 Tax=Polychytrium aggregatum TaxID=110093 RepID=UPI0022FEBFC9|nr:dehydrase and lipid transport-domain-containing protein [Polychytrium aggregatum]KAI9207784.1 dehydrase and lipid transport-domain-containing protein [Polychytrium aggregatum]
MTCLSLPALAVAARPRPRLQAPTRSFFNFPAPLTSLAKEHRERRLMNFSQRQLYDIVSDVDQYSKFLPYCVESIVLSSAEIPTDARFKPPSGSPASAAGSTSTVISPRKKIMKADLVIGFSAMKERYTSTVTCCEYDMVQAVASNSHLFRKLINTWRFTPNVPAEARGDVLPCDYPSCHVDFFIDFEFRSPLYAQAASSFFTETSRLMVTAFEKRAQEVYGRR